MTAGASPRRTTGLLAVAALGVGVLAACGSGAPAPAAAPAGMVRCSYPASAADAGDRKPGPPPALEPATGTATVTLTTSAGVVVWTADRARTPCTVGSFAWLASKAFFDGTPCHRLTTAGIYVLQCGDPAGDGSGGPGYTLPDEATDRGSGYPAGSVAMANTGAPGSGGSQFFLDYRANDLPHTYTPWGTITRGLDVPTGVAAAGTDDAFGPGDGHPRTAVTVTGLTVT